MSTGFKSKAEEGEWRRAKIIELKSQGLDQQEIAQTLKVTPALISIDLKETRKDAIEKVREYSTEAVPLQLRVMEKVFKNAISTYWKLSQEATHVSLLSLMRGQLLAPILIIFEWIFIK